METKQSVTYAVGAWPSASDRSGKMPNAMSKREASEAPIRLRYDLSCADYNKAEWGVYDAGVVAGLTFPAADGVS